MGGRIPRNAKGTSAVVIEKIGSIGEGRKRKQLEQLSGLVKTRSNPRSRSCPTSNCVARPPEFKQRVDNGESLDDLLPEAFACVREAARRRIGQRHFDVQVMGATALHQGQIAR